MNGQSDIDYPRLHDFARHTIHSTETLGVTLNTVDSIIRQHAELTGKHGQGEPGIPKAFLQTRQYMQFQHRMLASLRARSIANEQRVRNEINLVSRSWLIPVTVHETDAHRPSTSLPKHKIEHCSPLVRQQEEMEQR